MLATLFFSQGTPMLLGGDEFGRTQQGNNNAYCQDNEISWVDWEIKEEGQSLIDFTRKLIRLRNALPILRRGRFLTAEYNPVLEVKDVTWINASGAAGASPGGGTKWDRCHRTGPTTSLSTL